MTTKFPSTPGVYLFKDHAGVVIYIGKARSLTDRIRSYFQKTDNWKIAALLADHATIEIIQTVTEEEALLLEAQLVQQYQPKYNVLLKDGQPFLYILFTDQIVPEMKLVRNQKEKGRYFGPFIHKIQARRTFAFLQERFRLNLCNNKIPNGCLRYHLGKCAGNCKDDFDLEDYRFRIQLAIAALSDDQKIFKESIQHKIELYNKEYAFEKSKVLHDYLQHIEQIFASIKLRYSQEKFIEKIASATSLHHPNDQQIQQCRIQLQEFLGLTHPINTIDCFDISHFQSSALVGSCVRFTHEKPDKNKFRRFKIKTLVQQNDYAALAEIVFRRYNTSLDFPDLILIDGGKGQLNAVKHLYPHASFIALAKREETIFSDTFPHGKKLDLHNACERLLIEIRDYAHHFAVTYHRVLKRIELKDSL